MAEVEPHPPATRKIRHRALEIVRHETQPVQQRRRPRTRGVTVDLTQTGMQFADTPTLMGFFGRAQLSLDATQLGIAIEHIFDRGAHDSGGFLRHMRDHPAGWNFKIALILMQLTAQGGKQAGFAAAVGSGEADLPARVDLEGRCIDQHFGAAGQAQVTKLDHVIVKPVKGVILRNPPTERRKLPMTKYRLPILLAFLAPLAFAGDDSTRADELRLQAKALRAEAEASFTAAQPECYRRFLVNRCLDQAKSARIATIGKARELEIEASRIDLARKQREVEARGLDPTPTGVPGAPATPAADPVPADDTAAEAIRRAREEEAMRAEARAREQLQQRDDEKARTRAAAEAAAAERAEKAARDRERYDERIRQREAERAAQTPKD